MSMLGFWAIKSCGILGPEDGDSVFLRNVDFHLQVHTALQPTRTTLTLFKQIIFLLNISL
jgi:hypothetical protein